MKSKFTAMKYKISQQTGNQLTLELDSRDAQLFLWLFGGGMILFSLLFLVSSLSSQDGKSILVSTAFLMIMIGFCCLMYLTIGTYPKQLIFDNDKGSLYIIESKYVKMNLRPVEYIGIIPYDEIVDFIVYRFQDESAKGRKVIRYRAAFLKKDGAIWEIGDYHKEEEAQAFIETVKGFVDLQKSCQETLYNKELDAIDLKTEPGVVVLEWMNKPTLEIGLLVLIGGGFGLALAVSSLLFLPFVVIITLVALYFLINKYTTSYQIRLDHQHLRYHKLQDKKIVETKKMPLADIHTVLYQFNPDGNVHGIWVLNEEQRKRLIYAQEERSTQNAINIARLSKEVIIIDIHAVNISDKLLLEQTLQMLIHKQTGREVL